MSVGLVTRRCGGGVFGVAHVSQDGARAAAEVPKFHPWRDADLGYDAAVADDGTGDVGELGLGYVRAGSAPCQAALRSDTCPQRARPRSGAPSAKYVGDTLSVQPVWIYPVADLRSYMVHGGAAAAAGDEGTVRGVGMAQVQDRRRGGCGRRCGYRPATEGTGSTVATISQRTQVVEERVDRLEGTVGIAVFGLHHVLEERPRRL